MTAACARPLRDGPCGLDREHRGRCSTVTFRCDFCDQTRRGTPRLQAEATACWFCVAGWNRELGRKRRRVT